MIRLTALLLAVLMSHPATSSPSGEWAGTMSRGGDHLNVRFYLPPASSQVATFSAPDLGAIDIPLRHVQLASHVHWELAGDTTTTIFNGDMNGDTIHGSFSEDGRTGTFSLIRARDASGEPYTKRDVTFRNGDVQLAGTLFLPRTTGPHAAIIFVHGSGDEGRWASTFLADYVARHGIAALTYDKRGVGRSSGNWRTSTLTDLAGDARAGVDFLAQTAGVDRRRIGVYGHSQGGNIAPAIAQNNPLVSFVIDADGNVGPQYKQDVYRVNNILAQRYSGKELTDAQRLYREFVDVARSGGSHDRLRADVRAAGNAPWLSDLAIPDDTSWIWAWYARVGNYDDRSAWANVRVPVLIIFGGKDTLVPVQSSISQTAGILRRHGNSKITIRIFDDADHTLHVPPKTPDGWPHLPNGFPNVITAFILANRSIAPPR